MLRLTTAASRTLPSKTVWCFLRHSVFMEYISARCCLDIQSSVFEFPRHAGSSFLKAWARWCRWIISKKLSKRNVNPHSSRRCRSGLPHKTIWAEKKTCDWLELISWANLYNQEEGGFILVLVFYLYCLGSKMLHNVSLDLHKQGPKAAHKFITTHSDPWKSTSRLFM